MKYLCLLILLTTLHSCSNPEPTCNFGRFDLVTGVAIHDEMGSFVGNWKTPNDYSGNSDYNYKVYPNPFIDEFSVSRGSILENLWIIKTECLADCIDNAIEVNSTLQDPPTTTQLQDLSLFEMEGPIIPNSLRIDFSSKENGFYRLFIETNEGEIIWYNLHKREAANADVVEALQSACSG